MVFSHDPSDREQANQLHKFSRMNYMISRWFLANGFFVWGYYSFSEKWVYLVRFKKIVVQFSLLKANG